jgi:MoCo/4Fe-4S cofactor protein with predicted Tat translocation signal
MSLINIQTPNVTGKRYWRSLNELANTPEFHQWVHQEFPANATEMLDGSSRRTVLKLMAASFGLAGLAACGRPVEHILPNSAGTDADIYLPGEPFHFATVMSIGGHVTGLLVETHDGRPTKIEGNPDHPHSLGSATAIQQALVLGMYDPDRSAKVLQGGKESTWPALEAAVQKLSLGDGSGLRFLSGFVSSPSLDALRADVLKKFPKAKWVEYEALSRDNELAGANMAFGQPLYSHAAYDKAKIVVALDHDFLNLDAPAPFFTKAFSKRRKVASEEDLDKMNRLYAVESQFSLTGANADHRLRMKGSDVRQFAADLASALGAVPGLNVVNNGGTADKRAKFLAAVVKDLKAAGAEALVVAGPRQPASVHALAAIINEKLGSGAVSYTKPVIDKTNSGVDALKALTGEMSAGQVSTLVVLGGNPVYSAPADLQFSVALSKVANSIHLGAEDDETAAAASWHIPQAHVLESWGDEATSEGLAAIQQPMIEPMYGGKTALEIVSWVTTGKFTKSHDIVKKYWLAQFTSSKDQGDKEQTWRKALHDGVVAASKTTDPVKVSVDSKKLAAALGAESHPAASGIEVGFYPSSSAWDGRFVNNGWLQETPDPVTKLVWGNAAMISPKMARDRQLTDGDVVSLTRGNFKMEAAVMIQPGHSDDTISIALGYGRQMCGRVGKDVGYNANLIRTSDALYFSQGFAIAATGKREILATTQERGTGDNQEGRPLAREVALEEYKKNPKAVEEMSEVPEIHSIYSEFTYDKGNQWGMAIDLTSCTGCNACVVACQAENNTPVVGKDQVLRGREMHWIRMDRYYSGDENDPEVVEQPIPCMQCENAPCENVCPVQATSHSPEGLNDMAYNRCVGTRYCANNCPFKVRHFNFLNFHRYEPEVVGLVYNPDVSVRMRGVMEKCTYCVQRIEETKIKAKEDGRREIRDGEIKTACQQTCPAEAIVFGNINDPNSRVAKLKKQERNYAMLAELGIKPRTTYLAKLRNPNPELTA